MNISGESPCEPRIDFEDFFHADSGIVLLTQADGRILGANAAARRVLPAATPLTGLALAEIATNPPEEIRRYLSRCSGTRDGVVGALTLKTLKGPARFACEGALLRPARDDAPAMLVLRCRAADGGPHGRFRALTEKIDALHAQIHIRARLERKLEAALAEKEVLLRELHHRVKNNLQVITGILQMALARERDQQPRQTLIDAANRVQAMATVQNLIYQGNTFAALNAANFLSEICENISRSYNRPTIDVVTTVAPITLSLEAATPLGLLVTELVTNAFKHAFPRADRGTIRVSLSAARDNRLTLDVGDDGCGLPDHWRGRGTGTILAERLALQLGGELEVGTGESAAFSVTFQDAGKFAAE